MPHIFSKTQVTLLNYLKNHPDASITINDLADNIHIDQIFIAGDSQALQEMGILSIAEEPYTEIGLDTEGLRIYQDGFPERSIAQLLLKEPENGYTIPELAEQSNITNKEIGQCLKYLTQKKWAVNEKGTLKPTPNAKNLLEKQQPEEQLIDFLGKQIDSIPSSEKKDDAPIYFEEDFLVKQIPELKDALKNLKGRKKIISVKERTRRYIKLTDIGKQTLDEGIIYKEEVTNVTHAMLEDGSWKDVIFKPYAIHDMPEPVYPGKIHPFTRVLQDTRRVFFDMGFKEVASPHIESSFWNFDALFQPQDHPAREMQDTFYMKQPNKAVLPDDRVVDRVRQTHENGGTTGSIGWLYKWNTAIAKQVVLRTHNTSTSIRHIAAQPHGPQKIFAIGRVFRCETVDYKHLPEFVQVDGIIIDEDASFAHLIGTLEAFYKKMGFDKVDFRPGFFPYTEPSVEAFVYLESKKDWVEMGGAGIFRPEVTQPFGCTIPVLAWGLGLERLAMFRYNIQDIRNIYMADMKWLKEVASCQ